MKNYPAKPAIHLTLAFALVALVTTSLQAQRQTTGMSERDRNLLDRETQLTLLERGGKPKVKRDPQLLLSQINEDFMRLQAVNNEVKLKISKSITLDFKDISNAATEIKKRSTRLRTNLVFPDSAKEETPKKAPEPDDGQLKVPLLTLDRLIRSFVTNPVFTSAGVINAQLAAEAKADLNAIIDLSDKVKKRADKLSKATEKTP